MRRQAMSCSQFPSDKTPVPGCWARRFNGLRGSEAEWTTTIAVGLSTLIAMDLHPPPRRQIQRQILRKRPLRLCKASRGQGRVLPRTLAQWRALRGECRVSRNFPRDTEARSRCDWPHRFASSAPSPHGVIGPWAVVVGVWPTMVFIANDATATVVAIPTNGRNRFISSPVTRSRCQPQIP